MLKRIAPYLPVVSASLVFLSWVVSNGLNERARAARARTFALIESHQEHQRYWGLSQKLGSLEAAAIELLRATDPKARADYILKHSSEVVLTDATEIAQMMKTTRSLAADVGESPSTTFQLVLAERQVKTLIADYEQLMTTVTPQAADLAAQELFKGKDETQEWLALRKSQEPFIAEAKKIASTYQLIGIVLASEAEAHVASIEARARLASVIAVVTFVLGTVLAIYAKLAEVKAKRAA